MKRSILICVTVVLAAFTTFGAENAAGVWTWSLSEQSGETILTLKQEGEKLTGSYTNQFGKAEINDGTLKGNDISFKVKRDFNGQEFVIKYSGKLAGDKITGKASFDVNGETRGLDWEAKREAAKASATGNWNTALILGDGNRIEGTLKLKQDGDKLTGATIRNDNETAIQDGKVKGEEIVFTVVRERDGRKVTAKYKGKITGEVSKARSNLTGREIGRRWTGRARERNSFSRRRRNSISLHAGSETCATWMGNADSVAKKVNCFGNGSRAGGSWRGVVGQFGTAGAGL